MGLDAKNHARLDNPNISKYRKECIKINDLDFATCNLARSFPFIWLADGHKRVDSKIKLGVTENLFVMIPMTCPAIALLAMITYSRYSSVLVRAQRQASAGALWR